MVTSCYHKNAALKLCVYFVRVKEVVVVVFVPKFGSDVLVSIYFFRELFLS